MRPKRTYKARKLPVQWQMKDCAWELQINTPPADLLRPESYFIGLLGLGAALTASMPPIILTPKTSQNYELEQT